MEGQYLIGESSRLLRDFSIGFSIIVFVYSSYLLGPSTSSQIGFSFLEFTSFAGKLRIEGGAGCANGGWKFCDIEALRMSIWDKCGWNLLSGLMDMEADAMFCWLYFSFVVPY
ncbi:uncharacterized protein LOC114193049 isoform X2 [Vigna unguiculata]|uniref:uncharacterized protein LOC114193049 isoform X2 n=1 Tax=Vigna unguiculata TaxID=3917 RepID=UPI001016B017|nr:uncharacterized protein LOC114193049 isoform X2 [Vigna unguiculata]